MASFHRLVYDQIAGFFVGLPLIKLHCHQWGNWPGSVNSELGQDGANVAVLMDVDCAMVPIAFEVLAEIEADTPEIMHPELLLHLILDLPNQAVISNDRKIIDVQNDYGDDCALILKHKQSSIDL
jgi:hypothetical protein